MKEKAIAQAVLHDGTAKKLLQSLNVWCSRNAKNAVLPPLQKFLKNSYPESSGFSLESGAFMSDGTNMHRFDFVVRDKMGQMVGVFDVVHSSMSFPARYFAMASAEKAEKVVICIATDYQLVCQDIKKHGHDIKFATRPALCRALGRKFQKEFCQRMPKLIEKFEASPALLSRDIYNYRPSMDFSSSPVTEENIDRIINEIESIYHSLGRDERKKNQHSSRTI
jgi:hypothetical protein